MRAKKAIILARVSTEEQAKDNHFSIPAQLRKMREYCEKGGRFGTIKEVIAEHQLFESAFRGNRRKFKEALKDIEKYDEPIAIVFDVVDRFTRRWDELAKYDKLREEGKIELHFISQGLFLHRDSKGYEIQVWEMFVMMARAFSRSISDNVKRSIKEKLARGEFPGGEVPTGYLNVDKKIIVDEPRARLIRRCFRLYSTGKYSTKMLTEKMRKLGLSTKPRRTRANGKLMDKKVKLVTKGDVLNILRNPFYFGRFHYPNPDTGEQQLYPEEGLATNYEPILKDWKLYERVQSILDEKNTRAGGSKKNIFLFSKLLTCGFCGATLTPEEMSRCYKDKDSSQAKSAIYYHCTNARLYKDKDWYRKKFGTDHSGVYKNKKGETVIGCPQKWWKQEEVEEQIIDAFRQINLSEKFYDAFKKMMERDYQEKVETLEGQIKAARTEQMKNQEIISSLVRKIARETDPEVEDSLREELKSIRKRQDEIKEEIRDFEEAMDTETDEVVRTLKFCGSLEEQYLKLDNEGKRELISVVFSKITATKGRWRLNKGQGKWFSTEILNFTWREPFNTILELDPEAFIAYAEEDKKVPRLSITKNKQTKASFFP